MKSKKQIQNQSQRQQSTHRKNNQQYWKNKFISLSQQNNQLLQKQKRYLQQLQLLESRVEKQNSDALQLQSLYSQLMDKFQQKQMEIEELQLYYQPQSMDEPQSSQIEILKKQIEDLTECLNQRKSRINNVQKEERCACYKYFTSNSPLASEAAKLLGDVHRKLSQMTDLKIKLEHQNKFLVHRNKDLQEIRQQLNKLLNRKQNDLNKTRDQYIKLIQLQDATNKYLQKSNIAASCINLDYDPGETQRLKSKLTAAEDEAKIQTQIISAQMEKIKSLENEIEVRTKPVTLKNNEFFSFSQEKRPHNNRHYVEDEEEDEIPPYTPFKHLQDDSNDLPVFPKELEIEELIKTMGEKKRRDRHEDQFISGSERD